MTTNILKFKIFSGLSLAFTAALASGGTSALATDFSCRSASTTAENTICAHANLSSLDDQMARIYGRLWAEYNTRDRVQLRSEQRRFLGYRDACGRDVRCIKGAYLDQISVLDTKLAEILDK